MNIKTLIKTKDGKAIIENFLSLSVLQLTTMLLPLVTLPYVLRVLGYEKYGLIALAASLVNYFQSLVDYSFKVTAVRDVAIHRGDIKKLSIIYSRVMAVKFLFLVFALVIIALIVWLYPPFYEEKMLFLYTMFSLVGFALFPEWFFQGVEEMKYISLINVTVRLFFALGIFAFIKEDSDYIIIPLMNGVGLLISGIVGQYFLFRMFKIKFVSISAVTIINVIKENFTLFINQFMPNLYNNSASFLLGVIASSEMLGIYTAIRKVVDLCVSLLSILSRVFFPLINRKNDAFVVYRNLMFGLVSVGFLALIMGNKIVLWFLNLTDPVALPVLMLTGLSIVGFAAYDVYGLNYFIVKRKDRLVMKNTIVSSVFGLFVSIPLIYFYGIIGAAISLMVGRFLMGGVLFVIYCRESHAR